MNCLLKIAVCDDEQGARDNILKLLSAYLDKNEMVAQIDAYASGEEFLNSKKVSEYCLVILDIFMGQLTGMDVAKKIVEDNHNQQIIFCSSSLEYAAESYDVNALYYLVKPVKEEKFFSVMDRFLQSYNSSKSITVKSGRIEETILLNDIIYAEAANKKSIIHTKSRDIEANIQLSALFEQLETNGFIRPIRYAIVSLREIVNVPTKTILLSNGVEIAISRGEKENIKKSYSNFVWKQMINRSL